MKQKIGLGARTAINLNKISCRLQLLRFPPAWVVTFCGNLSPMDEESCSLSGSHPRFPFLAPKWNSCKPSRLFRLLETCQGTSTWIDDPNKTSCYTTRKLCNPGGFDVWSLVDNVVGYPLVNRPALFSCRLATSVFLPCPLSWRRFVECLCYEFRTLEGSALQKRLSLWPASLLSFPQRVQALLPTHDE